MSQVRATSAPSVTDVERIAAMSNRVIRNLEITECYDRLSQALRDRTGAAANWCTFATWASRQAGSTIRGEDLLDRFERRLGLKARLLAPLQSFNRMLLRKGLFEADTTLGRIVSEIHTPFDAFERASEAVAKGNLKVFEEIGREFARFLASVPAEARNNSKEFLAFVAQLRPGPPPEGQDYLKEAFTHYQQQRHETRPSLARRVDPARQSENRASRANAIAAANCRSRRGADENCGRPRRARAPQINSQLAPVAPARPPAVGCGDSMARKLIVESRDQNHQRDRHRVDDGSGVAERCAVPWAQPRRSAATDLQRNAASSAG